MVWVGADGLGFWFAVWMLGFVFVWDAFRVSCVNSVVFGLFDMRICTYLLVGVICLIASGCCICGLGVLVISCWLLVKPVIVCWVSVVFC